MYKHCLLLDPALMHELECITRNLTLQKNFFTEAG